MSEGPVAGAGTAPGAVPNGTPPPPATPTPPSPAPTAPPASAPGTETPADVQASQKLNELVNGPEEQRTPEQEIAHWKAMARKNEDRARENRDKALRLDAIEEANKTELQRAQERADRAEREVAKAKAQSLKLTAAAQYELPAEMVPLISGATEDEINASAEQFAKVLNERVESALASRNGNGQPQRPTGGRPVETLRPGAAPSSESAVPQDANEAFRGIISRRR